MGKIIISENVSLDGVVQDPTGEEGFRHGGWFRQIRDKDREAWAKVLLDEALGAEAPATRSTGSTATTSTRTEPGPLSRDELAAGDDQVETCPAVRPAAMFNLRTPPRAPLVSGLPGRVRALPAGQRPARSPAAGPSARPALRPR